MRDIVVYSESFELQQHFIFNNKDLAALVTKAGFKIIEGGQYFLKPFTHSQMQKLLDYQIIDGLVLDGLYELGKECFGSEIYVDVRI